MRVTIAPTRPTPVALPSARVAQLLATLQAVTEQRPNRRSGVAEPKWADAACRSVADVDWFANRADPAGPEEIKAAREVCVRCPIQVQCLTWALVNETAGVWGGLSENERDAAGGLSIASGTRPLTWCKRSKVITDALAESVDPGVIRDAISGAFHLPR